MTYVWIVAGIIPSVGGKMHHLHLLSLPTRRHGQHHGLALLHWLVNYWRSVHEGTKLSRPPAQDRLVLLRAHEVTRAQQVQLLPQRRTLVTRGEN